jgi:shikimate dehydrogenase
MYPNNDGIPIDLKKFPKLDIVLDVVYNPLKTKLVIEAQSLGIKAEGGLYMLVSQAISAYEYFMDKKASDTLCDTIYNDILSQKENIVLTGMPSSGKTTVGKILAEITGKAFVDTDDEIIKKIGMDIPTYFSKHGEAEFRKIESDVIKEISQKNSLIIATGGGAILNNDNIRRLKQNGKIYFLDRSLKNLTPTSDRPLSSDIDALKKRYNERYPIYISTCDSKIDANGTPSEVANIIYGEYKK